MRKEAINRRSFLGTTAAGFALSPTVVRQAAAADPSGRSGPIGEAKGIFPGRVVWVHDPEAIDWQGPEDGYWWQDRHANPSCIQSMLDRAVCSVAGAVTVPEAWDKLFRYLNQTRGRGDAGWNPGEKIVIKPNWVGMIYREGNVDAERYRFVRRENYMNTAPQMLLALLEQLTAAGVRQEAITVCDTLAYLVHEYHEPLARAFPEVRYEDYAGQFGRIRVRVSDVPLYWSCRPNVEMQDFVPTCFAQADYVVNFANLKAHMGSGVTLCAKNHYGSLVRWPVQRGYYDMHPACFSKQSGVYRALVDLMGHEHLGGKTVLNLIDGLFSGLHPRDPVPKRMNIPPFEGHWPCSLIASQDPVAIDSVGLDFLQAEWTDFPRQGGVDDYLREAALAHDPPSGTFYDPNHAEPSQRLASLGVHEHWNNVQDKQYSRNLGASDGIELVALTNA
ncbi:MAG: DUF362 domain-containing protein [Planctomycetaceae bacterium]|nr:MAG: DUF362 domain-containing protein [Planctomycetaceae bacterium]